MDDSYFVFKETDELKRYIKTRIAKEKEIPEEFYNDIRVNLPKEYTAIEESIQLLPECFKEGQSLSDIKVYNVKNESLLPLQSIAEIWEKLCFLTYDVAYPSNLELFVEIHTELDHSPQEPMWEYTEEKLETFPLIELPIWTEQWEHLSSVLPVISQPQDRKKQNLEEKER